MVAGNDSHVEIPLGTSGQNVVVIGAGFAGLSAACSLAKEGFKVTVLDKLPEVLAKLRNSH
jgi:NADPH-dependent 2,4-dienoyl-CoA reductase/sulfur reductase-like enzyme